MTREASRLRQDKGRSHGHQEGIDQQAKVQKQAGTTDRQMAAHPEPGCAGGFFH